MASEFRVPGYIIEPKGDWLVIQVEGSLETFCLPSKSLLAMAEIILHRQGKMIVEDGTEDINI